MKAAASLFEIAKAAPAVPAVPIFQDHKKMLEEVNRHLDDFKRRGNPQDWRNASTADVCIALSYSVLFRENSVPIGDISRLDSIVNAARTKFINLQTANLVTSKLKKSMVLAYQYATGRY